MQVKSATQFKALCEAKGVEREVSLLMLQGEDITPGDYLVIHSGYAIEKISAAAAQTAWEVYDQMLVAENA